MWNKENGPSSEPASTPSFLHAALQHMGHLQEGGPWFTAPILGHLLHQSHGCCCVTRLWASYPAHRYLAEMPMLGLMTLPEIRDLCPQLGFARSWGCPFPPQPLQTSLQLGWKRPEHGFNRGFCKEPPSKVMLC